MLYCKVMVEAPKSPIPHPASITYLLTVQDKGRDLVHKGAKVYFNIRTIPTVASTVCINKSIYFSKKRERERKIQKRGEAKRHRPRNSSCRIHVGIVRIFSFRAKSLGTNVFRSSEKHCHFWPIYRKYLRWDHNKLIP